MIDRMAFGKYRGKPMNTVPTEYLVWAVRNCTNLAPDIQQAMTAALRRRGFACNQSDSPAECLVLLEEHPRPRSARIVSMTLAPGEVLDVRRVLAAAPEFSGWKFIAVLPPGRTLDQCNAIARANGVKALAEADLEEDAELADEDTELADPA